MNPMVDRVLERLSYEKLLLVSGLTPRKRQITLTHVLKAAFLEPRIFQVLPGILLYKPKILKGIKKDLKQNSEVFERIKTLFDPNQKQKDFFGIDIRDCQKSAMVFRNYLNSLRGKRRNRLFNLRLNEKDWEYLKFLSNALGIKNYSEIIRRLIHESAQKFSASR